MHQIFVNKTGPIVAFDSANKNFTLPEETKKNLDINTKFEELIILDEKLNLTKI